MTDSWKKLHDALGKPIEFFAPDDAIKMSLHTTAPQADGPKIEPQNVSWGSASPEIVTVVWIGDDMFVRPDWDAYRMGQLDMLDKARAAVMDSFTYEQTDAHGARVIREHQVLDALATIDALKGEQA